MRILRWTAAGMALLALTSCGVFFAPLEGRWNPLDPKFGEGYTEKTLYTTEDGFVMAPTTRDFASPLMRLSSSSRILMKFSTADIPSNVAYAELSLYLDNSVLPDSAGFVVRLVLMDWDPMYVDEVQISSVGFLAPLASAAVSPQNPGWYSWNVTSLLQSVAPSSVKGLFIEPEDTTGGMERVFRTHENGTDWPHLAIWTR